MRFLLRIRTYIDNTIKSHSLSNRIEHYITKNDYVRLRSVAFSNTNGCLTILQAEQVVAYCEWHAQNQTERISCYLLKPSALVGVGSNIQLLVSEKTKQAGTCVLFACRHQLPLSCLRSPSIWDLVDTVNDRAHYASKIVLKVLHLTCTAQCA